MSQVTLAKAPNSKPPPVVQIGSGVNKSAKNFEKRIPILAKGQKKYISELFFAGSFVSAIFCAQRAALMELVPKALIGGVIRAKPNNQTLANQITGQGLSQNTNAQNSIVPFIRSSSADSSQDSDDDGSQGTNGQNANGQNTNASTNASSTQQRPNLFSIANQITHGQSQFNFPVALDECFLELPEYVAMYFMPTIASVAFLSRALGKMLDVDFEFLGQPLHEFEKNLGKEVSLGTLEEKRMKVTPEKLNKLAMGKTMLTASVVALCGSLEYIVPSLRDFLTKWFLGYDDFSKLLGFDESLDDPEYAEPEKRAGKNIKDGLIFAATSVAAILGIAALMRGHADSPKLGKFFRRTSKHFDLGKNFELSNTPLAVILLAFAIPGYMNGLRGRDEKLEVMNRVILYSIPTIILYKQVVLNLLTYCSGLFFGIGGGLNKLFPQMKDQVKQGKRDPLNWNFLSDFSFDKKTGEFSGMITELPEIKAMKREKREAFLHTVGRINSVPLVLAPLIGMFINIFNLQKIFDMHKEEKEKLSQNLQSASLSGALTTS